MARTQQEIEQEILQAKSADNELAPLNSISQTAIWLLWVRLTAFIHQTLEQLFDIFRAEITAQIEANRAGTVAWYVQKAKEFQNGDVLNSLGEYDAINPANQIISRCAVREVANGIAVKVAKGEPPQQLNAVELQNFMSYLNKVKFAGVATTIINLPADVVLVDIVILYDQVGEAVARENVKESIKTYIKSIAFDGDFVINDMIALCRTRQGVIDVLVNNININSITVMGRYTALSGYYAFDAENINNNYVMMPL